MADTRPTNISYTRAIYLCALLLFAPKKFQIAEEEDNVLRSKREDKQTKERSALIVRRAFWQSLMFVATSALIGWGLSFIIVFATSCTSAKVIAGLQIGGAMLFLWGTLFVRGWEIETWSGVSLTERVNRWLYRILYCTGTSIIVLSLALSECS